jgi:hypothetical protein
MPSLFNKIIDFLIMFQIFRAARLVITLSLTFIASFFSNAAAADISVLTHTELSRLQAVCADNGSASEVNNSKKTLLLFHTLLGIAR